MGDVWSSLALAEACAGRGDEVKFVVSGGEEATIETIRKQGYPVRVAPTLAEQAECLRRLAPHVVVVNKLNSRVEEIRALKRHAAFVVTLDDVGEAAAVADLRINVLYHTADSVTDPRYVCLRSEFRLLHEMSKVVNEDLTEIVVSQGGSDTLGFTPMIVRALARTRCRPHVTVILGPTFRHYSALDGAIKDTGLVPTILRAPPNMAELLWRADLAITAGGLTCFEAACVGVPALVIAGEPFELETASRLAHAGAVVNLGFGGEISPDELASTVDAIAADTELRRCLSERGKAFVDGAGSNRVTELIHERAQVFAGGS